jgi:LemA protein
MFYLAQELSQGAIIGIIIGVVVLGILLILLGWWISTRNWFNQTKVKIDEAKSSIDISLTKRYDLLTKSLATVKGYAKHEYETITKTIELRNAPRVQDMSMKEKSELAGKINEASHQLNVVMENYPDLKASENFSKLQLQIQDCEDNLQASRRIFNSNVSIYNQKLVTFPSSLVANSMHLTKEDFFEAEAAKKEDVKIEF